MKTYKTEMQLIKNYKLNQELCLNYLSLTLLQNFFLVFLTKFKTDLIKFVNLINSTSASPSTSITSSPPISPGNEMNFYQPNENESQQFQQQSFKYPMNYFTQLHPQLYHPHFELFQHSRLFYPPIGEFNGLLCK